MSPRQLLLSAAALLALSAPAIAEDVAITNATVVIGDGSAPIPNGTVVLRGGKVLSAGAAWPCRPVRAPSMLRQVGHAWPGRRRDRYRPVRCRRRR